MICPKCGKENKDSFRFCQFCGEKLEGHDEMETLESEVDAQVDAKYCPNCKQVVNPTDTFCGYCGETLKEEKPSEEEILQDEMSRVLEDVKDEEAAKQISEYKEDE